MLLGMYIGSASSEGQYHLDWEIVDNVIREELAGIATHIEVISEPDDSITGSDDGSGIPVDIQEKTGLLAVETVFTGLHAGGKLGGGGCRGSGGLPGGGTSVGKALSTQLDVRAYKNGRLHVPEYTRGQVVAALDVIGETDRPETTEHYTPDSAICIETATYDFDKLAKRVPGLAFLNRGLRFSITDKREGKDQTQSFHDDGGIASYVYVINENTGLLFEDSIYTHS